MTVQREILLCRYQYDPLDRLADCAPLNQENTRRFYRKNRLATEVQGQVRHSVFESEGQVLAQQRQEAGSVDSALLATDLQRSVLYSIAAGQHLQSVYSPYGHRSPENGLVSLLGFNGERQDPVTGHYLLGNGYRAFNPVLMRFNGPDSLSPFGKGGVNAYAYCLGDPVNLVDPKGEFPLFARGISHLVSTSTSALRQAGKGLRVMKRDVISSLNKARKPVRPGHGPLTTIESGREWLTPTPKSNIGDDFIVEAELYKKGAEYRLARKAVEPPPIARYAKSKDFSEQDLFAQEGYQNFPEVQQQYQQSLNPQLIERFRQADADLLTATGISVKKSPANEQATRKLVALIRSY